MTEILYHGSQYIIEHPEYGKGARANDYGRGFYCTENPELAKEWACAKKTDGFANRYSIPLKDLSVLYLNAPEYSILNWLALLAKNRTYWQRGSIAETAKKYLEENFLIDTEHFDVIVGYRADDSYFAFAQDFVSGAISLRKLARAMRLGSLGEQIVLKSRKAFDSIVYEGFEPAPAEIYFARKSERDIAARRDYRDTRADADTVDEIFILDILREEMKPNDPRLR